MGRPLAPGGLKRFAGRFAVAQKGGILPMAAAGVPVAALLAIAAAELASLSSERARMQDTADAVALDAANQLSFSPPDSVLARAEANARDQLADMEPRTRLAIRAEMVEDSGVRVTVDGTRLSFFGNMLPPGGFKTAAAATAVGMNTAPLCVVVLDPGARLRLDKAAEMEAGECLVHSNGDIEVKDAARLRAYAVQTGGSAQGAGITPAAQTGAKTIEDPFGANATAYPVGCADTDKKFDKLGSATLQAGRHCGHLDVEGTTVTLAPGVHVFNGEIQLKTGTRLVGGDVLLVFEEGARFNFDSSDVRLDFKGLRSGPAAMHGFVFAAGPGRTSAIELETGFIERLEGVVYAPKARLRFGDQGDLVQSVASLLPTILPTMGAKSKWTVIVAKEIEATEAAAMLVNSDYVASDVPVPTGVGNKTGRNTRLLR